MTEEIAEPEQTARHFEGRIDEFLFSKTNDWASEYEFRYVAVGPDDGYEYVTFDGPSAL